MVKSMEISLGGCLAVSKTPSDTSAALDPVLAAPIANTWHRFHVHLNLTWVPYCDPGSL